MAGRREADCPLCGAKLDAAELFDACGELVDRRLGVLAAQCPHCQGYLEVRPEPGCVHIGYLTGGRFDAVRTLPCPGLVVLAAVGSGELRLAAAGRSWRFTEAPP